MSASDSAPTFSAFDAATLARCYPWPADGPWLRAMMVLSLDGAVAGADGRSGSISSPTDRLVMAEARRLSDAVLIGAGTLRAERYTPMRARAEAQDARRTDGQASAPVLAIVSGSLDLPWDEPVFSESTIRPLVLTTREVPAGRLEAARAAAEVIVLPGQRGVAVEAVAALHQRGLQRIVCEGGVRLLAEVARDGLIDEVDLSLSPLIASGGQVTVGVPSVSPRAYALTQVLHHEGFLFTRYLAVEPTGVPSGPA